MRNNICFSNYRNGQFSWDATICNILDLATLDRAMWGIFKFTAQCYWKRGLTFRVTAARKPGDSGVHNTHPLRALDVGTVGISRETAREIEAEINEQFPRTDGKPTALYHDSGGGAHIHIQCPWDYPVSELSDNAGALA